MSFLFSQPAPGVLPNDSVSFSELVNINANSVLGNPTPSATDGSSISFSDLTQDHLSLFSSTEQGVVPASGGGTTNFLRADGQWQPAGVSTAGALEHQVLVYDGAAATWAYAGLGDGTFGTANVILGANKPTSLSGTKNILISSTALNYLTTESNNIIFTNTWVPAASAGSSNVVIGIDSTAGYSGDNVVIGANTSTNGLSSVAIGRSATVWGRGVAVGRSANASGGSLGNIAIGPFAESASYNGGSIAIGDTAKANANFSTSIGYQTLSGTSAAVSGTIIGAQSGKATLTGINNTVVGANSFNATGLTAAASCVVVGQAAATAVTTATNLTSVGMNSCLQLTTGSENTVVGYYAGSTNSGSGITTGAQNVCIGARAAVANGTDSNATAVGFSCSAGISSVAVGQGSYSRGTGGVAIGAGAYTGTNNYNTVIGYSSLQGLGIGQNGGNQTTTLGAFTGGGSLGTGFGVNTRCLYLGTYAGSYSGGKTDEFMLDNQSRGSYANTQTQSLLYGTFNATPASQTLTINATTTSTYGLVVNEIGGNFDTRIEGDTDINLVFVDASADNVGIGTATPAEKLEVNGNVKVSNGNLSIATAGKGLAIKSGADAKIGVTGAFPGGGTNTVTVNTTAVTTNSIIFISAVSGATTIDPKVWVSTITANTSFVISSGDNSFTGTVGWMIVEATP